MAGARYTASGSQTLAATLDTTIHVASNGTTAHRTWIYDFQIGDVGTPADNVVVYTAQRMTAVGTHTDVTPTLVDLADRAAQADVGENHTAEPTYTASEEVWEMGLNTRAAYRWVAPPGGEFVTPATTGDGIGWGGVHASATTDNRITVAWVE